jgi:glutathione synthase/RimK-type ligase-like ATP-grasp enzyme
MIGIFREEVFSPNRVEDDAAILRLTAEAVGRRGYDVELKRPHELSAETEPTMAFAMCEGLDSLRLLERWESEGYRIVNSPRAVKNCYRHRMLTLLNHGTVPFPKTLLIQTSESVNGQFNLRKGVWVKRGDVHSTQPGDVELIFDRPSLEKTLQAMRARWVEQAVLQEHVHGDLIKFYGVLPQRWFRHFYHKPEEAKGLSFSLEELRETAELSARKLGLQVYGGDIVVTEDAHYLIDINSWPSFAICREEAAEEIASYLVRHRQQWEPQTSLQWRSA